MELLREFCAENMTLVPQALSAGARRIELCDNLAVGGTTPSYGVIRAAIAQATQVGAEVMVMVRPRGGSFVYTAVEEQIMHDDARVARCLGASGIVFGCLAQEATDGELALDVAMVERLIAVAKAPLEEDGWAVPSAAVTFHMAFDELSWPRQQEALDVLASLGVERVLTHGGPLGTPIEENYVHLARIIDYAANRIAVMPGGGISFENAGAVASALGVHEVHGTRVVDIREVV